MTAVTTLTPEALASCAVAQAGADEGSTLTPCPEEECLTPEARQRVRRILATFADWLDQEDLEFLEQLLLLELIGETASRAPTRMDLDAATSKALPCSPDDKVG